MLFFSDLNDYKEDLCHLAWLIRDGRFFLDFVDDNASCANGKKFNDLLEEGFNDCPYVYFYIFKPLLIYGFINFKYKL